METKKIVSMLLIAIVAIFMLTMVLGSVQAVSSAKVKVTWNGNGGKIGNVKTTVSTLNKGANIKLPKTPKRTGYRFSGWYTKKSGGTKITTGTKVKKKVAYYAHWNKNKALNANEKRLVGSYIYQDLSIGRWVYYKYNTDVWESGQSFSEAYVFNADGTFEKYQLCHGSSYLYGGTYIKVTGTWSVPVNGKVNLRNRIADLYGADGTKMFNQKYHDTGFTYIIGTQEGKQGLISGSYFYVKD